MATYYSDGTITLTNGSAVVTGSGTAWQIALIVGGVVYVQAPEGNPLPIVSVDSNTQITAAIEWTGASGEYSYAIQVNNDVNQVLRNAQALSEYIQRLDNPSLGALASLTPAENTVPVFTGPETAAVLAVADFLAFLGFSTFMAGLRTAADQAAARSALGAVNRAGDTMTGTLTGLQSSAQFPPVAFLIPASTHATSTRATFQIGSWQLLQDVDANGVRDLACFSGSVGHRLRISPTGQIGLMGNPSPSGWLDISSTVNATRLYISGYGANQGYGIVMRPGLDTATPLSFRNTANTDVGSINTSATGTFYATTSDYRLKTEVEPLVSFTLAGEQFDLLDDAVLRIMAMRPVSFTWVQYPELGLQTGFIAHELQQAAPHAVSGQKDAEEDIGTATIPEQVIPAQVIPGDTVSVIDPETGNLVEMQTPDREVPEQIIPAQVFENVRNGEIEGAEWVKTGTRPVYQAVDHGRLTPDLVAAVQSLTLMVLEQRAEMKAMADRIAALEN